MFDHLHDNYPVTLHDLASAIHNHTGNIYTSVDGDQCHLKHEDGERGLLTLEDTEGGLSYILSLSDYMGDQYVQGGGPLSAPEDFAELAEAIREWDQ